MTPATHVAIHESDSGAVKDTLGIFPHHVPPVSLLITERCGCCPPTQHNGLQALEEQQPRPFVVDHF